MNTNGRFHFVVYSILRDLGSIISCANFRGYTIARDIAIQRCAEPDPTPVDSINPSTMVTSNGKSDGIYTSSRGLSMYTSPSSIDSYQTPEYTRTVHLNTTVATQSLFIALSSEIHKSSGAVTLISMTQSSQLNTSIGAVTTLLSTTSTLQFHDQRNSSGAVTLISMTSRLSLSSLSSGPVNSTSTSKSRTILQTQMIYVNGSYTKTPEESTLSVSSILSTPAPNTPGVPVGEDDSTNNGLNIIAILVGVFVSLLLLLLLVFFLLASINLCMRRATRKRRYLQGRGTDLTTPSSR